MKIFYQAFAVASFVSALFGLQSTAQTDSKIKAVKSEQLIPFTGEPRTLKEIKGYPDRFEQEVSFGKLYGANGPLRNVRQRDEIIERRDAYSKHYRNTDGSVTAMVGAGEIHYMENGLYHTILTDISSSSDLTGYNFSNKYNKFKTFFGAGSNNGILVKYLNAEIRTWNNKRLEFLDNHNKLINKISLGNSSAQQSTDNSLTYPNVASGINATVTQKTMGFETDLILNQRPTIVPSAQYVSVTEEITLPVGWKAGFDNHDGKQRVVITTATGEFAFAYEAPYAYEQNHRSKRTAGEFAFTQSGQILTLQMLISAQWLADTQRNYPVVLDPTANFTPNNSAFWTGTVDEDGDCNTDDGMRVGFEDGNTSNDDYQCYAKFNISSIPTGACVSNSFVNIYQNRFENDRNDDNNLQFYFQAFDPFNTDPVPSSCAVINSNINGTGTVFSLWDVWGNCGGTCNDYDENTNNSWKLFNNYSTVRVQNCLAQGFVVASWDYRGGHSDPFFDDNDEIVYWDGRSSSNRPYMTLTYETASTNPTSINASTLTVCPGGPVTLTVNGGTLGSNASWRWYKGGCGVGTSVGTGATLTDNPSSTTTYYVRAEGPCNTTSCAQVTVSVSGSINTTVSITSTPANPGPWCAGGSVVPATSLTATVLNPPLLFPGIPASATWSYRWEVSTNLGTTWSCVNNINTPVAACPWASNSAVLNYQPIPAITQTTMYRYLLNDANTGCIVSSNTVTFTVLPQITDNTILDNQTICVPPAPNNSATPAQLIGYLPSGGNGSYLYRWQSSPNNVIWSNIPGANTQNYQPSATSATTYYRRLVDSGPCTDNVSNVVTVTIQQSIAGNTVASAQTFCVSGDPVAIGGGTLTGGSGVYSYQWQSSPDSGNTYNDIVAATAASYDPPLLTQTTYFRRLVNSGSCSSTSNAVPVNILVPVYDNDISGDQITCSNPYDPATLNGTTPMGALGSYTYQWQESSDGGSTWTDAVGALPNSYDPPFITGTTAYRRLVSSPPCATSVSNIVTATIVPPIANNNISPYQSFCQSGDPANIVGATPTGAAGSGSYNFQWQESTDLGASWQNIISGTSIDYDPSGTFTSTTYYRRIVTSGLCSSVSNVSRVVILQLPQILTVTKQDIACAGGNTGTITVTASTTNGNLFYSNNNGSTYQAGNTFGSLGIGDYYIVVRDDSSCSRAYVANPVTITQAPPLVHTADSTDASCAGVFDGTITVNASGGVPPYTYSLNGGPTQPGNTFTGLSSGTYTVRVFDFFNCVDVSTITVNNSYVVTGSIVSQTDVSCFGRSDGQVEVLLSGGIPQFEYSLNGLIYQASPIFTGLAAGSYIASMRDLKGCSAFVPVTVSQPALLTVSVDSNQSVSCNTGNNGAIYISVTGGTSPYSYLWSNGSSSDDIVNIAAGNYSINITDFNGCTTSATYAITQPTAFSAGIASFTNLKCNGDSSGVIDISVYGGTPGYTFNWSNGDTTEDLQSLTAQLYSVTITDANGCETILSQLLTEPTALVSSVNTITNVTCFGGSDGSVGVDVSGGVIPYSFLWSNFDTNEDLINASAGNYGLVVTDANGCTALATATISQPTPIELQATNITNVLCHGGNTGSITLSVLGGSPQYNFIWSNGASTQSISSLAAGNYGVTLTDANTCTASASFTVTQADSILSSGNVVNPGCVGTNNGSIVLSVVGGNFPYSFAWNNGSTSQSLYNIGGGTYDVTITDAAGCLATASFTLVASPSINTTVTHTDVSCNGYNNGTASVTAQGGTPPFTYLWSTFQVSPSVTGLNGGLYYVIVSDAVGCQKRDSVLIVEPLPLTIIHSDTNITCHDANDGVIDVTVNGGTAPYQFFWSNGTFNEDATGLAGGTYTVFVSDVNSCTISASATIVNPSQVSANFIVSNVKCFGGADGQIDLIPSGGTPGYTYNWSSGATVEDVTNLLIGIYTVTIADQAGCTITASAQVTEPQRLVAYGITKPVTCHGDRDGAVNYYINGGTPPYSYIWSNLSIRQSIDQLSGGMYYVTATDANGCQVLSSFSVYEPDVLTLSLVSTNVSCFNGNDGNVAAVPGGGTKPYEYLWNNFVIDSFQSGVQAGRYTVILTDSSGCHITDSLSVTQPTEVLIDGSVVDAACNGAATGSVTLTIVGGIAPYTYSWTNGDADSVLNNVTAGTYTVTVTDANGCVKTATFTVNENAGFAIDVAVYDVICFGGNTGSATAIVNGGVFPYQYAWGTTPAQNGVGAQHLVAGSYTLTVTDARNCTATTIAVVNEPAQIVVTTNALGAQCFNTASGQVIASVTGGVSPFTYSLNGTTQANDTFTGLLPGNYLIQVTDVNGCTGTAPFTIVSPEQISVDLTSADQVILTGMSTQLTATVTSTSNVVSYTWSPAQYINTSGCNDPQLCPTPLAAPVSTTTFWVTVTDQNQCIATDSVTITVNNEPSAFIPSAFTPNGDGLNDRFEFDILGATNIAVKIFNRWGALVFDNPNQTNGLSGNSGWDGMVDGKLGSYDTYTYQMRITYFNGVETDIVGTVTLMR